MLANFIKLSGLDSFISGSDFRGCSYVRGAEHHAQV